MIKGAAAGNETDRQAFARRYEGVIRAYLLARWGGTIQAQDIDDAIQEVFVEAFREGGILEKADPARPGGFRAFLYGVLRNVARRHEKRRARRRDVQPATEFLDGRADANDERLSKVFDRHWATAVMREAASRQREHALEKDEAALRRVDLLRLRFRDGLPIRDIAERWEVDPVHLHREYAKARREFREALEEVVAFHHPGTPVTPGTQGTPVTPGTPEHVQRECASLMELL